MKTVKLFLHDLKKILLKAQQDWHMTKLNQC